MSHHRHVALSTTHVPPLPRPTPIVSALVRLASHRRNVLTTSNRYDVPRPSFQPRYVPHPTAVTYTLTTTVSALVHPTLRHCNFASARITITRLQLSPPALGLPPMRPETSCHISHPRDSPPSRGPACAARLQRGPVLCHLPLTTSTASMWPSCHIPLA